MGGTTSTQTADVVVVGGGIVGCAVAYYATRAGLATVLVERDGIATGTSGCCMGHLMVVPSPDPMRALTLASVRLWHALRAELGTFELNATGALWLAECAADLELLDELERVFAAEGCAGERLDAAALRAREPGVAPDLPGAYWFAEDGVLMPMLAAGALLRAAMEAGAVVWRNAPVTRVLRSNDGAVTGVITPRGAIAAPHVVLAAGVWSAEIAASAGVPELPVYARRGDLAITMPRETPVRHQLLEVGYLRTTTTAAVDPRDSAADPGAHALNVQPQSNGTCLIGSTRQFAPDRAVQRALLRDSLRTAARFVPGLRGARVTRTWAGLRPYTLDKLPLIGPVGEVPGLWLATGHEGLGISLAPITGALIADAIGGQVDPLMHAFHPTRLSAGSGEPA